MDSLLLGGALSLAVRGGRRQQVLRWGMPLLVTMLAILLLGGVYGRSFDWQHSSFMQTIGFTVLALFSTGLIASTLRETSVLRRVFLTGWLRSLGKYSYGIYVWHLLTGSYAGSIVRGLMLQHGAGKALSLLAGGLVGVAVSVVAGAVSYNLYEVHFIRLKRFFSYQAEPRVAATR